MRVDLSGWLHVLAAVLFLGGPFCQIHVFVPARQDQSWMPVDLCQGPPQFRRLASVTIPLVVLAELGV